MNLEYILPDYVTEEMVFIVLSRIYGMPLKIDENNTTCELNKSEVNLLKIKDSQVDNEKTIIDGVDVTNEKLVLDSNLWSLSAFVIHFSFLILEDLDGKELANFYLSYKKKVGNSYFNVEENMGLVLESSYKISLIGMHELLSFFGGVLTVETNEFGFINETIVNDSNFLYKPNKDLSEREKRSLFIQALKKIPILSKESLNKHVKYLKGVNINNLIEMQIYREKEIISDSILYKEKTNKKVLKF